MLSFQLFVDACNVISVFCWKEILRHDMRNEHMAHTSKSDQGMWAVFIIQFGMLYIPLVRELHTQHIHQEVSDPTL